jgi:hypothetical protein
MNTQLVESLIKVINSLPSEEKKLLREKLQHQTDWEETLVRIEPQRKKIHLLLMRSFLEEALNLGITLYGDRALHQKALTLARSLNLTAAYDAHYLALAENFNAEFYKERSKTF